MITIATTESPTLSTRHIGSPPTADPFVIPARPFSESLLAASKSPSKAAAANDRSASTRRLKSSFSDTKTLTNDRVFQTTDVPSQKLSLSQVELVLSTPRTNDGAASSVQQPFSANTSIPNNELGLTGQLTSDVTSNVVSESESIAPKLASQTFLNTNPLVTLNPAHCPREVLPKHAALKMVNEDLSSVSNPTSTDSAAQFAPLFPSSNGVPALALDATVAASSKVKSSVTSDSMGKVGSKEAPVVTFDPAQSPREVFPQNLAPKILAKEDSSSVSSPTSIDPKTLQVTSGDQPSPPTDISGYTAIATTAQLAPLFQCAGVPALSLDVAVGASSKMKSFVASADTGKVGSKEALKDGYSNLSALNLHPDSTADLSESKTGSGDSTPSADQSQVKAPSPLPIEMNALEHTLAAGSHILSASSAIPTTPQSTGHVIGAENYAGFAPAVLPQLPPTINTAKLIQNMGRSEMRVGLQSPEFGSISISTSTTRDAISAQISLDHSELAKALAVHLPELQARLGGNHEAAVRINVSGQGSGPETATPGGTPSNSSDEWRGARQQTSRTSSRFAEDGMHERDLSHAAAAITTNDGGLNVRLDIRV